MAINQKTLIKDTALIAICAAVLLAQQMAFSFLPNVQLTTLLIVIYAKTLGFKRTTLIVIIHVLAYNILSPFGAVTPIHMPSMFIGWMIIPLSLTTFLKKVDSPLGLAIFGFIFGFIYGWAYIPAQVFFIGSPLIPYLMMDIPFEIVMGITNFLTIYWLYTPLKTSFAEQLHKFEQKEKNDGR
jgi:hypothetical protein